MKKNRPSIHKKAWNVFSKWIRNRDPYCVTCGAPSQQAGHFWHGVLDFDEENISGQCIRCNHFLSGNLAQYSIYLLRKLGKKKFEALDLRHTRALAGEKRTDEEYNTIIEKYSL